MNILVVSHSDTQGGAARAAYRLHLGLQKIGLDSKMLVQNKINDDITVIGPASKYQKLMGIVRPSIDKAPLIVYKNRDQSIFSLSWLPFNNIVSKINLLNPDIVHLHWIAGGMFRIEDLTKIKCPIVWSLQDMWLFTGGCHLDSSCGKYTDRCGNCPKLNSQREKDFSYKILKRKEKSYSKINDLIIVGLSRWLTSCAQQSKLFKNIQILNLPNPIDTNIFKPIEKKVAREILNLPIKKSLILFGAMSAVTDPNKGFSELNDALMKIEANNAELVIFGSSQSLYGSNFIFPTYFMGHINDNISLKVLYSAVDVTVVPSLQENLSNVIMESLSCGTPVVAFNIGGNPDMIDHLKNGFLATPYEPESLAKGIEWVINHPEPELLSNNARQKVLDCFEMEKVAKRYKALYEEILYNKA